MNTEERILAAGRDILSSEGLRAITTNAIAQRARVSKKTLYRLFASKDALLEAIVVSLIEGYLERWDAILDRQTSAIDKIQASLRFVSDFLPRIQQQVLNQVESVAPQLWTAVNRIRMKRLQRLATLMKQAQGEGFLRQDVDPEHWTLLLMETVSAVFTSAVMLRTGISLVDLFDTLRTVYYEGLLTDEGRRHLESKENS